MAAPARNLVLNASDLPNSGAFIGVADAQHTLDTYIAFCCGGNAQNKANWAQQGFESWHKVLFSFTRREDPKALDVMSVAVVFDSAVGASQDYDYARKAALLDPAVKSIALSEVIGDESSAFLETPTQGRGVGSESYIVFFRYRNVSDRVFIISRIGVTNLASVVSLAKKQAATHH